MKNLYKKTSAMLLAGTIMIGGFMVSGLNVHANSHTAAQERDIQRIKSCCKDYGNVSVMDSKKELDEAVKDYSRSQIANNGHIIKINNPYDIPTQIKNAQRYGKKFVEIECHNLYYLININ